MSCIAAFGAGLSGYVLKQFGLFQLIFGPLADRFGKRQVITIFMIVFTVATGLCALGSSLTDLIVYRALTGIFAASIMPVSLALIADLFPNGGHWRPVERETVGKIWTTESVILRPGWRRSVKRPFRFAGIQLTGGYWWRWSARLRFHAGPFVPTDTGDHVCHASQGSCHVPGRILTPQVSGKQHPHHNMFHIRPRSIK